MLFHTRLPHLIILVLLALQYCNLIYSVETSYNKDNSAGIFEEFLVQDFGVAENAVVSLDYSIVPSSCAEENNCIGNTTDGILFLLMTYNERIGWYSDVSKSTSNINNICNRPSIYRQLLKGKGTINYIAPLHWTPDRYSVLIARCNSVLPKAALNIDMTLTLRNPLPYSNEYSHLPIDEVMLPHVAVGFLIIYCMYLAGLLGQIYFAGERYTKKIHYYFVLSLCLAIFAFIFQYASFKYYDTYGYIKDSLLYTKNITYALFEFTNLTGLLLVSMGWSIWRANLRSSEVRMVNGCLSVYFFINLFDSTCLDGGNEACVALTLMKFVLRAILLLAIILALNFTVTQVRSMLVHSPWVPSTPIQYARCQQLHSFRYAFGLFLVLPLAIETVYVTTLSWQDSWLIYFLLQLSTALMIFHVGVNFSPLHESQMTRAFDGRNRSE